MLRIRPAGLVAAAAIVFAACQGAASPSPTSAPSTAPSTGASAPASSAPATSPSASIKEGGDLIVGLPGDMVEADPSLVSDSNSSYIHLNVIEGLLGVKPGTLGDVIPVLASDLPEKSADGLTYTFKLRQGVKFHDGTDFNADAVVYNYDRQKNAPKELQDAYNYYFGAVFGWGADSNLKSVEKIDDFTVKFTLNQPQSNFLISQAPLPQFGIQSPTALKAGDADNPDPGKSPYAQGQGGTGKSMVGTGPFMFKEWVPNDHVTIVKNPNYWDSANMAHLDSVTFKPYADQAAELNALQAGDIDLAQTIAPNDIETLKGDSNFQVIDRGDSCNVGNLEMNQKQKPFDNQHIRTAIAYALNKQSYIDAFYAGLAEPADNFMPPATQYYKPLGLPTYDPDKAKAEIAASGLSGDALTLTFYYPSDVARPYMPDPKGLAQAIANDLEAVGFKVNFKTEGWRTGYLADEATGKFPMWLLGWTCDWPGPDNFLVAAFFHFQGSKPNPEFAYGPPELKAAFDKGATAPDDATAQQAWSDAQDILARDLPFVPLVHSKPPAAASAAVQGFVGAGNLNEALNSVWLNR
ncbi:MAG TPA: ABC transporter substrate-binding protein [Candidatus Limnocylindrales bacterium]|nr:ABC transporter substrate-binding protein [Candidatus Limnocylindrales bacterium]